MKPLIARVIEAALREMQAGRRVVVLMEEALACESHSWGNPQEGLFIRSDIGKCGLKSLKVNTLILVNPSKLKNAEFAAENMLTTWDNPKIIEIGETT